MNETNFELILDQALELLAQGKNIDDIAGLYPEHAAELKSLLVIADDLQAMSARSKSAPAFEKTLKNLPALKSTSNPKPGSAHQPWFLRFLPLTGVVVGVLIVAIPALSNYLQTHFTATSNGPINSSLELVNPLSAEPPSALESAGLATAYPEPAALSGGQETKNFADRSVVAPGYAPEQIYINEKEINSTDNREFLKTYYFSILRTRQVEKIGSRVQTTVRGFGGRVDYSSINKSSASFSFVIPQKNFAAFKDAVRDLVGDRFIAETISNQNLLPEKRIIEESTNQTETIIRDLESKKTDITKEHNRLIASYNAQIQKINSELNSVLEQKENATDPETERELATQEQSLYNQRYRVGQNISAENANYKRALASLDAQIKNFTVQLDDLAKQDQALVDNVETVRGNIDVQRVSMWGLVTAYVPASWLGGTLIVLSLGYMFYRRRQVMEVQGI